MMMLLVNFLLVVGYAVLSAADPCSSGRLLVSTLPDSYPQYQYMAGIFTQVAGQTLNNASVYKHENLNVYMHFEPLMFHGAQAGGCWVISVNAPGEGEPAEDDIMMALSTAHTPDDVRETWQVYDKTGATSRWVPEPSFTVQCVTKSVAMCPYGNIVLTGLHSRHNIHDKRMGLYVFSGLLFQSRPVFYHEETDKYLFFRENMWLVGADVGTKQGSMFVMDYAYDPEFITSTWVVFNRKYFAPDDNLRVTCPNVTEINTDVLPDYESIDGVAPGKEARREDETQCTPGYCLHDGSCNVARSGSFVCLCRAGYLGARCQDVVSCPAPPPISHGSPIIPPSDDGDAHTYPYLSIVKYTCHQGFHLNSDSDGAMCDGNGRWSHVPKCRAGNFHFTPQAGVMSIPVGGRSHDTPRMPARFPQPADDDVAARRRRRGSHERARRTRK